MRSPIVKIQNLLKYLPVKDVTFGETFLHNKDIDSLKELVDSAYYLVKKYNMKGNIPDKYQGINIDKLYDLKVEVDNYHSLLANIFKDEEYESELDNEIFEEEIDTI